jgi:elongation factor Tu
VVTGVERTDVQREQVLCAPGSIKPHKKFLAQLYVLKKRGWEAAHAVLPGVPAAILHPHDGRNGEYQAARGMEMMMPGDNVQTGVKLIVSVAIEEGLRFAVREDGRTVGAGIVTTIVE